MPNSKRPVWRTAAEFLTTGSLARSISALLALGLVLMLVVNLGTYVLIQRTQAANEAVARAQDARLLVRDIRSQMLDLETGQRGFLLTGEPEYLDPYDEAKSALPVLFRELESLGQSDAEIEAWVARLKGITAERVAVSDRSIELARQGRIDDASRLVRSGRGRQLMLAMRAETDRAEAAQAETIRVLYRRSEREAASTTIINALAFALILVLGVIGGWMIYSYVRDIQAANSELDEVNAGLERTVRQRTRALSRANEEIQRFAYIVSHDLRAPLVNVMGYTSELEQAHGALQSQLAAVKTGSPNLLQAPAEQAVQEDVPEAIGFIRTSTEKMDRLINAILKLSREGQRELVSEPIQMEKLVKAIADSVHHQTEAVGASITVGSLPNLNSDRLSIDQVFGNLIDNAVKYLDSERPGRIKVSGETVPSGDRIYRISDNGRGVSEKDYERIFELFRRAGKQDQPGEGLGLAFVRSSVRRLGGDIRLESELGKGSTFVLTFPGHLPRPEGERHDP